MKKENNLISIIIPVYKVEKYLDRCVESIINQTYKNIEIILINDGSPDRCPEMCDEWAKKDKRIKVIHKKNGGLSDARNVGIDIAKGNYITFVDSDDYIDNNFCESLLECILSKKCDFVMSGISRVYDNKKEDVIIENKTFTNEEVVENIYLNKIPFLAISCGKLYKKEVFNQIRYPIGRLHEDEYVSTLILTSVNSFSICNNTKYNYYQRNDGITASKTAKNVYDILLAYDERINILNIKYPNNFSRNLSLYLFLLRNLYVASYEISKESKKQIKTKFKEIYRQKCHKNIKDRLFRYFPGVYVLISKLKVRN